MPDLNVNITLVGYVNDFNLDGFEKESLNFLFGMLDKGNLVGSEESFIGQESVRHYTYRSKKKNKTCSMFYRYGNSPESQLWVYGIGKHCGDNNQDYNLITHNNKKEKKYTLNPTHKDSRYKPLYEKS